MKKRGFDNAIQKSPKSFSKLLQPQKETKSNWKTFTLQLHFTKIQN